LGVENGGMSMINIQEFIYSKRIKLIYRILHEPLESWNAIGKYWLRKLHIRLENSLVYLKTWVGIVTSTTYSFANDIFKQLHEIIVIKIEESLNFAVKTKL
jgi:hypothetical protein